MRYSDTLARIGGDEFVALLSDLETPQDCEPALTRLLMAASEPLPLTLDTEESVTLRVSASIGVTLFPDDDSDADQLLRHADQAMYAAKQMGKNRYFVFDIQHAAAQAEKFESLEHIRRGFENREFVLHYQPKVNMQTGELIGVEALIRWSHPERGLLMPVSFLPMIENHALALELGEWVIDTALKQIAAWQQEGLAVPISVNVAARHLQHPDFAKQLAGLLANNPQVAPASLELEILETSALDDMTYVSALMRHCHDMGVRFALDDFGIAYSSLTYLNQLPVDVIKIDRSFIKEMSATHNEIVSGIIGLAEAFKLTVVAEGVETIEQGQLLLSMGCQLAQGYVIAKPMPADAFLRWRAQWHPDHAWTTAKNKTTEGDAPAVS
jgi:EAL domain-containing protein (putative c-di-GMP-specific phosphodiesterase class I)